MENNTKILTITLDAKNKIKRTNDVLKSVTIALKAYNKVRGLGYTGTEEQFALTLAEKQA